MLRKKDTTRAAKLKRRSLASCAEGDQSKLQRLKRPTEVDRTWTTGEIADKSGFSVATRVFSHAVENRFHAALSICHDEHQNPICLVFKVSILHAGSDSR